MIAMGIDVSTKCGVAVVDTHNGFANVLYTDEIEFKKLTGWERVVAIASALEEVRSKFNPDLIAIEAMFIGHTSSAMVLGQLNNIIRYFMWQEDHKYIDVPATTLKKWLTGKGTAQKDVMMMEVYKQFHHTSKTNNIADAIALGMFGLCYLGNAGLFTKEQTKQVDDFKKKLICN